jgi:hypothetical protein
MMVPAMKQGCSCPRLAKVQSGDRRRDIGLQKKAARYSPRLNLLKWLAFCGSNGERR